MTPATILLTVGTLVAISDEPKALSGLRTWKKVELIYELVVLMVW